MVHANHRGHVTNSVKLSLSMGYKVLFMTGWAEDHKDILDSPKLMRIKYVPPCFRVDCGGKPPPLTGLCWTHEL